MDPGWRYYYPYSKAEEHILPELKEGERLKVLSHEVLAKETQPPARYGQGRLVKLMDELGLGTKSTRHDIISKLYSRAYIQGSPVKPTNTAYAVIDALEHYAPSITKPEMTRSLETEMTKIADGERKEEAVIQESRGMLERVFDELLTHQEEIGVSLREGLRVDKIVGKCQRCGNELIIRRSRKGGRFIGCGGYPKCSFTLPLPKMGGIVVTDKRCEIHQMSFLRIINKGKRPWDLGCPHCNFMEWQSKRSLPKAKRPGLEEISGLGPKSLEKLNTLGIKTPEDLLRADPADLAAKSGISQKKIVSWQSAAKALTIPKTAKPPEEASGAVSL
jgi:DNA topoisomerase-1